MFVYAIIGAAAMAGILQSEKALPTIAGVAPPAPVFAPPPSPAPWVPAMQKLHYGMESAPLPASNPGSWVTSNDYPASALQEEREGMTGFELSIDVEGKVTKCLVTLSSGSQDLDDATCSNLMSRARFYPAQDKKGKKIAGTWRNRVRWVVPAYDAAEEAAAIADAASFTANSVEFESYPSAAYQDNWNWTSPKEADFPGAAWSEKRSGTSVLWLDIDTSGKVTKCTVKEASGHDDLDQKACVIAQERATFFPAKDIEGKSTPARNAAFVFWRIGGESINRAPPYKPPLQQNPFLKSVNSQVTFTMSEDGSVSDCVVDETGEQKIEGQFPICSGMIGTFPKFKPFTDINGKPERRRVKVRINMETDKAAD
jgi:TonB family protein